MSSPTTSNENIYLALEKIPPADLSYENWITVGMALKSEGLPCEIWETWSQDDERYVPGECEKKWETFNGGGVTAGTIFYLAKKYGWTPSSPPNPSMDWEDSVRFDGENHQEQKSSPKFEKTPTEELIEYIKALYKPSDIIGYVTNALKGKDKKLKPGGKGVYTRTAREIVESLTKYPADITKTIGNYDVEAGAWIRINPLNGEGIKNENVAGFTHVLVESDKISPSKQESLYRELKLPIATLVHSGGKSVHAVVKVDATSAQEYGERVSYLFDFLKKSGLDVDTQNKNPSRLSRMPGVMRNGNRQYLMGTNVGSSSWAEWKAIVERDYLTATTNNKILQLFKPLENFQEEDTPWLVPEWIPADQITVISADGGTGKTSIWINFLAGFSSGRPTILDTPTMVEPPSSPIRKPLRCLFISTEDSVKQSLKKKLREAGANLSNIFTIDLTEDKDGLIRNFKFGSPSLAEVIRKYRPSVCVLDPLQGFIPADMNMGSRNAMRDCMAPLIGLGEECETTFIIICHTNKRKGVSGRMRMADSADIWDIARSVLMAGYTEDREVRYLSQEKNNYGPLQETILYSINDGGLIEYTGTTWKHDDDFRISDDTPHMPPCLDECKDFIIEKLKINEGAMSSNNLKFYANMEGFSVRTLKRAKKELKVSGKISEAPEGKGGPWMIQLIEDDDSTTQVPDSASDFPDSTDELGKRPV